MGVKGFKLSDGSIVKYDYSALENVITDNTLSISGVTANGYGHANDATYCSNTGLIYLTSMETNGKVYALDPSTGMTLTNTYIVNGKSNTPSQIWCLAYDRNTERFIAFDTNNDMLFYDQNFNLISYKNVPNLSSVWPATRQGMETDGTFIYAISYQPNLINVIDMNGKIVKHISCSNFSGEPETMCYDWINNKYYIEGISTYYTIKETVFK